MTPPPPNDDATLTTGHDPSTSASDRKLEAKGSVKAASATHTSHQLSPQESEQAIEALCDMIGFETVSATAVETGFYVKCAEWLTEQLRSLDFLDDIFWIPEAPDHAPVVVAVWKGRDSTLPVLLLNSHYDVVPAVAADWDVPPFDGVRQEGRIYGRGAQDMKCVCIQYMAALRKLHSVYPDWKPERDIVLTYVPDEEVGGDGMASFLCSDFYKNQLPGIVLALDEGLASTTDTYSVYYGERLPWWIEVTARGPTGHGSRFIENTAVEQLIALAKKALKFRETQRRLLGLDDHSNCAHAVAVKNQRQQQTNQAKPLGDGDVTTLNITTLQAGVRAGSTFAFNCVPPHASLSLDIRVTPHTQPSEISDMLDLWCRECSSSNNDSSHPPPLEWSFIDKEHVLQKHDTTSTDPNVNPWYAVLEQTLRQECGIGVDTQVFPGATDSRFLRALGVNALCFSPMRNCPMLLHEVNEYIPEDVFVEGVGVYVSLLYALGSYQENGKAGLSN